jgi:ADP-ribosylglycohydrolase
MKNFSNVPANPQFNEWFRGCLLGGAVGDALGAPVEFNRRSEILRRFGSLGIRDYVAQYPTTRGTLG